MKIIVSQFNPIVGDLRGNTRKILERVHKAKRLHVAGILFSELAICGYPPQDLLLHKDFVEETEKCLETIIQSSAGITIFVGLVRRNLFQGEKDLFNSVAIIHDQKLLGFHDKWLLPTYDVFDERRYFEPGKDIKVWEIQGKKIALTICEDIWQHAGYVSLAAYKRDPIEQLAQLKPDLVLNLSASPYEFSKPDLRIKVCEKVSKTLRCPVIMCCQVGANDQIVFDGYSIYVNAGSLCQLAKGFEEEDMLIEPFSKSSPMKLQYDPLHDLYEALSLGTRDYLHKNHFNKVCIGLSGGVDSSLVAALAVHALGPENVLGVSMPSQYTSQESKDDAIKLAANLNIEMITIPIEPMVKSFHEGLHASFLGKPQNITEENLQARIRGVILMALSNKHGYIVLSTGNKSEIAMGYCTLYGDMCGALSVIGDVKKTQVYELCKWINQKAGYDLISQNILKKEPSAELRFNQKDIDSLPDYKIVDAVLEGYVEDYLNLQQIVEKYQVPLELVQLLIKKVHFSEYKRRQGAPAIRVSKKSFGIGRHFPIVQGWVS